MLSRVKNRRWVSSSRPRPAVAELPAEQGEADAAVGDVRDRGDDDAVVGDERADALQDRGRILEVLEHVGEEHRVESLVVKLRIEIERLGVTRDDSLAEPTCLLRRVGHQLDTRDLAVEAIAQDLGHVSGRGSELENARAAGDEIDHEIVRRAGRGVEVGDLHPESAEARFSGSSEVSIEPLDRTRPCGSGPRRGRVGERPTLRVRFNRLEGGAVAGFGWSIRLANPAGTRETTTVTRSTLPSLRTMCTSLPSSMKPCPAGTTCGVQVGSSPCRTSPCPT